MALITCVECGKEFSDKAKACPNCACPTEYVLAEIQKEQIQHIAPVNKKDTEGRVAKPVKPMNSEEKAKHAAIIDALTEQLWVKGLISREEQAKISTRAKEQMENRNNCGSK